jgi:SNF2 family DNA or RNA helicase
MYMAANHVLTSVSDAQNASTRPTVLQIKPFVLRRTKDQVLSDLPPKIIQDVYVEPSPLQA